MPQHQPTATTRKVFRQPSAHMTGWVFIVGLAIACILYLVHDISRWFEPVALCVVLGLVVWVLLVRPSVVVAKDGVELHNLVRDVTIPWAHVDLTTRRWNLKVHTPEGARYGSWAISQQRPRRESPTASEFGPSVRPGSFRHPTRVSTKLEDRPSSADAVAALIERTKEEYDAMVRSGELTARPDAVMVEPSRPALIALAVAAVLLIVVIVTFG